MGRGKKNKHALAPPRAAGRVLVDGAQGEGGGQILRSSVSLAALTGRSVRLERIRAGRPRSGLAAQHLTSVRAVAEVANAALSGDELGSTTLDFTPRREPRAGRYSFNVADARKGGSAGACALVLQSVLLPLVRAGGESEITLLGGTHVAHSPPYDFLERTFLPLLRQLGVDAELELKRAGFYPVGGGRLLARLGASGRLAPLQLERRGSLKRVRGRALTARLEAHVSERMIMTVEEQLAPLGVPVEVEAVEVEAKSPGAAIFLEPEYERGHAGFSAVGERGKPAERVAEEAVKALQAHHHSGGAVDVRLADQLLLPLAFADGPSAFTTSRASNHLLTNAAVVEQFGVAEVEVTEGKGSVKVTVKPLGR